MTGALLADIAAVVPRVVQRIEAPPSAAPAPAPTPAMSASSEPVIRRTVADQPIRRALNVRNESSDANDQVTGALNGMDELVELLEQRILRRLERRGGTSRGGW